MSDNRPRAFLARDQRQKQKQKKNDRKGPAVLLPELVYMIVKLARPDTMFAFARTCKQLRVEAARNMYATLSHKQQKALASPIDFRTSTKVVSTFASRYDYRFMFCSMCDARVPFVHPFIFNPRPTYLCLACSNKNYSTRILLKEDAMRAGLLWEDARYTHHFVHERTVYISYRHMMEFMSSYYDLELKRPGAQHFERSNKWERFVRLVTDTLGDMSEMSPRDRHFVRNNLTAYAFEKQSQGKWGCHWYSQRPLRRIIQDLDAVLCVLNRQREKTRKPGAPKIYQIRDQTIFYHKKVF